MHKFRHLSNSANILAAVCIRKSEITIQTQTNIVAIKDVSPHAALVQLQLQRAGDSGLASA
jgi:hypothetical protein